ncbi:MAG: phosphodiester glycosidase family protein [Fimbriimonadaceae bacterium]|nr:phosphodiester glycosidase family protein [Fimbriimonadaceae bacterium]
MIRLTALLAAWSLVGISQAQVWEKMLAPGLTYRMEADLLTPRLIHAFRLSLASPEVRALPELATGKVFRTNATDSRETLSAMTSRTGAIGGVNADFFPFNGDPLGLMIRNGELLSFASKRAVFWWNDSESGVGTCTTEAILYLPEARSLTLDGWNEECGANAVTLNTAVAGASKAAAPCVQATYRIVDGSLSVGGAARLELESVALDNPSVPVPEGRVVIAARGNKVSALGPLFPGNAASLTIRGTGLDWPRVKHALGGGPFLVRNGRIGIDASQQGFNAAFSANRHPRTAVGITSEGDVWVVTVDGRQSISAGATLEETARLMLRLGCVDAVNLDGGGSTTFNLFGITLNRPSDGRERPVANALLVFSDGLRAANGGGSAYSIPVPSAVKVGDVIQLKVVDKWGGAVPNLQVVWAGGGAGWIDQGGLFRASAAGKGYLAAWIDGIIVRTSFDIAAK